MKRIGFAIPGALALSFGMSFAVAQPGPHDMAARTELHAIETLTLSDQQFLTGDANGRASDTDVADRPIRIFAGTQDDFAPVAPCRRYVERLKAAERDVRLTEYPTASHAFANPQGAVPAAVLTGGQTVRHCVIREEPEGVLINAQTQQPFTYKAPRVE